MRTLLPACALIAASLCAAGEAQAQYHVTPFVGYTLGAGYDNAATFLTRDVALETQGGVTVGAGVDREIGWDRLPFALAVRASVELAFVPGESLALERGGLLAFDQRFWQAGLEALGDVPVGQTPVRPYLGFGLTYARFSADFETSGGASVDGPASVSAWALAPSVLAGLRFGRRPVTPLIEARYRFATPSPMFSAERLGSAIDNGVSVIVGARVAL